MMTKSTTLERRPSSVSSSTAAAAFAGPISPSTNGSAVAAPVSNGGSPYSWRSPAGKMKWCSSSSPSSSSSVGGANNNSSGWSNYLPKGRLRRLVAALCFLVLLAQALNLLSAPSLPMESPESGEVVGEGASGTSKEDDGNPSSSASSSSSSLFVEKSAADEGTDSSAKETTTTITTKEKEVLSSGLPIDHDDSPQQPADANTDADALEEKNEKNEEAFSGGLTPVSPTSSGDSRERPIGISRQPPPAGLSTIPLGYVSDVNASSSFRDRWCDLRGADWYPSGDRSWQLRAPYLLIPGAKHAGTTAVADLLTSHPAVRLPSRSTELHFFLQRSFGQRYVAGRDQKTLVRPARERMYARDYPAGELKRNANLVALDASSSYLYYSSVLPRRILCVLPWVKLVVVLQHPVDRLYSQYWETRRTMRLRLAFEDWIRAEFKLMERVGLIPKNGTAAIISSGGDREEATHQNRREEGGGDAEEANDEDVAWYEYQTRSVAGAVGRSLYEIQLRQWIEALRAAGRDPAKSVWVVRVEDLAGSDDEALQREYVELLKFLGLPGHSLSAADRRRARQAISAVATAAAGSQALGPSSQSSKPKPMDENLRKRLEKFYAPYNERMHRLLRSHGIPMGTAASASSSASW